MFVTAHGRNTLYRNNARWTFTDVTRQAGLDQQGLWTAAVFFDADNDGDEDLFLGHFVQYTADSEPAACTAAAIITAIRSRIRRSRRGYTGTTEMERFADVSGSSGIGRHKGKVFGAVATDVNNDGLLDLFVANDSVPNFLFINRGGLRFDEIGLEAGVAYSSRRQSAIGHGRRCG